MKKYVLFISILFHLNFASAQQYCTYSGRYYEPIFSKAIGTLDIEYAKKMTSAGRMQTLVYDIYEPENDEESLRPLVIMVHGGGYIDFIDQKSPDIIALSENLVKMGYVVASIEYREESNPLSLLSEEKMMKAVSRSLEDLRDAICQMIGEVRTTNAFRIDTNKVIACGVSAGAVSLLHGAFMDSIATLPGDYPKWVEEVVGEDAQTLLDNRYCGGKLLGIINISGALLNADWVANDTALALLNIHGTNDPIVPFKKAFPFGLKSLPRLEGSYYIHQKAVELGMNSVAHFYPKRGHVPFLGWDLDDLFSENPIGFIFLDKILDSTQNDIRDFCYKLINQCSNDVSTGIRNNTTHQLQIYPNPAKDKIFIEFPQQLLAEGTIINIFDHTGQIVLTSTIFPNKSIDIQRILNKGYYVIQFLGEDGTMYTSRFVKQ